MAVLHPSPPFDDLTYYPISRWIRGMRGQDTIVDSRRAVLVWEPGKKVPIYAFPREDVALASGGATTSLARGFADPDLDRYITIPWDSLDHWFEEDEEVFVHPRNPYARVDALRSSRHVRVERDGVLLAESDRPVILFETGLPVRYYLPREDVRLDALKPSETTSHCAYKGEARYWSHGAEDIAWTYETPLREAEPVRDLVCFFNERVDIEVDGTLQERP